jgi:hypothetical protein
VWLSVAYQPVLSPCPILHEATRFVRCDGTTVRRAMVQCDGPTVAKVPRRAVLAAARFGSWSVAIVREWPHRRTAPDGHFS